MAKDLWLGPYLPHTRMACNGITTISNFPFLGLFSCLNSYIITRRFSSSNCVWLCKCVPASWASGWDVFSTFCIGAAELEWVIFCSEGANRRVGNEMWDFSASGPWAKQWFQLPLAKSSQSGYFASGVSVNINQHTGWPWTSFWNHSPLALLNHQGKASSYILRVTTHTQKQQPWLRMIGGTEVTNRNVYSWKSRCLRLGSLEAEPEMRSGEREVAQGRGEALSRSAGPRLLQGVGVGKRKGRRGREAL